MPTKGSKAASRQSKLSRKKRRDRPGPQQTDPGPVLSPSVADATETAVAEPTTEVESTPQQEVAVAEVAPSPQPAQSPAARLRPSRRPGRRVTEAGEAQVYKHLGGELRQIGIISVIIAAILVALTFVLG